MSRLVVVSNRLPNVPVPGAVEERRMPVGGLASALLGALRGTPGSFWLGWNGETSSQASGGHAAKYAIGGTRLLGLPLTQREITEYYRGFCNGALWPLFHGFLGRVRFDRGEVACYRQVSLRFAQELRPLLQDGDLVWVHDYHFLCLGRDLRRLGWTGAIGFFLHVPFPPYDLWEVLPEPQDFLHAMLEYDLIGVQTLTSLDNLVYCCRRAIDARWDGARLACGGRSAKAGAFPVGIEPASFLPTGPTQGRGSRGDLTHVVRGRKIILGVDRLDYTKGIPERLLAFERLLRTQPRWRREVSFVQIASPSRSRVPEYIEQKQRVDLLVGRINGEMADHDWVPVRYLYRSYPQDVLVRFYREADVGLVTPLRDGMNLIAKEFVAAQDRDSPGVLVLSRFAGAAEELREAVLVNPHVPSETADGIARALSMPLGERIERHRALLAKVMTGTASAWSRRFLDELSSEASRAAAARRAGRRSRRFR